MAAPETPADNDTALVGRSFREGARRFREIVPDRNATARYPWYLYLADDNDPGPALVGTTFGQGDLRWLIGTQAVFLVANRTYFEGQDAGHNAPRWDALLRQIEDNRAGRPLDGVLVSVGAERLQASISEKDGNARLDQVADVVALMLNAAWQRLGMRLPVYLLVSNCQNIPGFVQFGEEVGEGGAASPLGWNSPYNTTVPFQSAWVDEAFRELTAWLSGYQLHKIATETNAVEVTPDRDNWIQFPSELQTLRKPANRLFGRMLESLSQRGALIVRSLHFTGLSSSGQPLFLEQLLNDKVTGEWRLAEPVPKASPNRRTRQLQAGTVLFLALLVLSVWSPIPMLPGYLQLRDDRQILHSMLESPGPGSTKPCDASTNLLENMDDLDSTWFGSPLLPASWKIPGTQSRFDREIVSTLSRAFSVDLFGCLSTSLDAKIGNRIETFRNDVVAATEHGRLLDKTNAFASDMTLATEVAQKLHRLSQAGFARPEELNDVLRYTGFQNSRDAKISFRDHPYYKLAIAHAASNEGPFSRDEAVKRGYREGVSDALGVAIDKLYKLRFSDDTREAIEDLAETLNSLYNKGDFQELLNVQSSLEEAISLAGEPRLTWLARPSFDPPAEYPKLYSFIKASALLGDAESDTRKRLQSELDLGAVEFRALRTTLLGDVGVAGKVIEAKDGTLAASPGAIKFDAWLKDVVTLLKQHPAPEQPTALPAGTPILWNDQTLREALDFYAAYKAAAQKAPSELAGTLPGVDRAAAYMYSLIRNADRSGHPSSQGNGPVDNPEAQIANLTNAAPLLTELLNTMERISRQRFYPPLADALRTQIPAALSMVSGLASPLYRPAAPRLATVPAYLTMLGLTSQEEMPAYLATQRRRVSILSKQYARPLLDLLTRVDRNALSRHPAATWVAIASDLDLYEQKSPTAGLTQLEQFLTVEASLIVPGKCRGSARPTPAQSPTALDWFGERHQAIQAVLVQHCLAQTSSQESDSDRAVWREIDLSSMADKFPFAPPAINDAAPGVELRAMQEFFAAVSPSLDRALAITSRPTPPAFSDLVAWKAFFGPALKRGAPLEYDYAIEIEPVRAEAGPCLSNQIIDWRLEIGRDRSRYPQYTSQPVQPAVMAGRWTLGDPVRLSLRWAQDGTCAPRMASAAGRLAIQGDTATLTYDDAWSLIRMVAGNRIGTAEDSRPHLLRIPIPVALRADGTRITNTYVYIRVVLRAPGEKDPVRMPELTGLRRPAPDRSLETTP